jgi:hypothetical protein
MNKLKVMLAGVLLVTSGGVNAGIYTDDLSRCLIEKSTSNDKIKLVKWMFTAMSLHPAVNGLARVTKADRDAANKEMAELMMDLITVRCVEQSKKAVQYEGAVAIQTSFQLFGQIAGKELFSNPQVAEGMSGLQKYIDADRFNKRLGLPANKPK